jgi:5-methyltetrahydrofolate--homocysteine methyltransferase
MSLFEDLKNAIIDMDPDKAEALTRQSLSEGETPMDIVRHGLIAGIDIVGEKFKNYEFFLPEVMMAANAFKTSFAVVQPQLIAEGYEPKGRVLIGTVQGDNHDIGKNIVIALLQGNGYEVHDAGVDVSPARFVELTRELKPHVLGMSALLTTTMANMRDTVAALTDAGLRDSVKVIIGGSCVYTEFAEKIGVDGYGDDATEAVTLVNNLISA